MTRSGYTNSFNLDQHDNSLMAHMQAVETTTTLT